jgi:hypothetical protein
MSLLKEEKVLTVHLTNGDTTYYVKNVLLARLLYLLSSRLIHDYSVTP